MRRVRAPEDLLPGLKGPLEPVRARISFGEERRETVACMQLLAGDVLAERMQSYAQRFSTKTSRYLVSLWSQKYLATVIVPVMALAALGGRAVDADIGKAAVVLAEGGEPVALRLPSSFAPESKETAVGLLVSTHLAPFVAFVSDWSGLSRKVLWGNAAHYLEWIMGEMAGAPNTMALPVPMTDAIHYVEEGGVLVRRRKVCCLRDRVPGVEHCGRLCPERKTRTST